MIEYSSASASLCKCVSVTIRGNLWYIFDIHLLNKRKLKIQTVVIELLY